MSIKKVTLVVSPRDRFSGLSDCIDDIYKYTEIDLFDLIILDLGYPKAELKKAKASIANKDNARIVPYGSIIPMEGIRNIRGDIETPYTFLLDNDSRVSSDWLPPLISTSESTGAAVVSPLTLETEGIDGAYVRNHVFTVEIRKVEVENKAYLIEHKLYRRELPENMPTETMPTQAFELHGVMFRTDILKSIELPNMTMREHLDIGMQLKGRGELLFAEPKSIIYFDNLGTRAKFTDLQYFNFRWNSKIGKYSHDLFEKRWGYKWYSEDSIYLWCMRRRLYLVLRWLFLPIPLVNVLDRVLSNIGRRLFPIWDPLKDPIGSSTLLYDELEDQKPIQLSHDIKL